MTSSPPAVTLCAEADGQIGFGHLSEVEALGSVFQRHRIPCEVLAVGEAPLCSKFNDVEWVSDQEMLAGLLRDRRRHRSIWSFRRSLSPTLAQTLVELEGAKGWIADTIGGVPEVDLLICPMLIEPAEWIPPFRGRLLAGLEYLPLDPVYQTDPVPMGNRLRDVLLTLGGADRSQATLRILPAIAGFASTVVVGPGFVHRDQVVALARSLKIEVEESPGTLRDLLQTHKLVVTAGGNTLFEACCSGAVPIVTWEDPHEESHGKVVAAATGAVVFGSGAAVEVDRLRETLDGLLRNSSLLRSISAAGRRIVDGHGANRIAEAILAIS